MKVTLTSIKNYSRTIPQPLDINNHFLSLPLYHLLHLPPPQGLHLFVLPWTNYLFTPCILIFMDGTIEHSMKNMWRSLNAAGNTGRAHVRKHIQLNGILQPYLLWPHTHSNKSYLWSGGETQLFNLQSKTTDSWYETILLVRYLWLRRNPMDSHWMAYGNIPSGWLQSGPLAAWLVQQLNLSWQVTLYLSITMGHWGLA